MRRCGLAIGVALLLLLGAAGPQAHAAGSTIKFDVSITLPASNGYQSQQFGRFGNYDTSQLRILGTVTLGAKSPLFKDVYTATAVKATVVLVNRYHGTPSGGTLLTLEGTTPAGSYDGSVTPKFRFNARVTKTDIPGCTGPFTVDLEHSPANSASNDLVGLNGCGLAVGWDAKNVVHFSASGTAPKPKPKPAATTPAAAKAEPVVQRVPWSVKLTQSPGPGHLVATLALHGSGTVGLAASGRVVEVTGALTYLVVGGDFQHIVTVDLKPVSATYRHQGETARVSLHVKVTNLRTSHVDCVADPEGTVTLIDNGWGRTGELELTSVCGIHADQKRVDVVIGNG